MIIRPIRKSDLDAFEKLAESSNIGMINLPKNRSLLDQKINYSIASFDKKITAPENEKYVFVLEDLESSKIGGTSGIFSQTAMSAPIYYYKCETLALKQEPKEIQTLKAISYKKEPSEVAALFLHPDFRKGGFGKLLSLGRFLFVAGFKERFKDSFFADIRGVINDDHTCPFWEAIGRHFLNLNYEELMKLAESGRGFIKDILPKYPIYIPLLPKEAQKVIGKPHESSYAAFNMLNSQGFEFANEIDIFDGGPRVVCKTAKIKTIKTSIVSTLESIVNQEILSEKYLISNERLDFRATIGYLQTSKHAVKLHKKTAEALELKKGDALRYVAL